MKHPYDELLKGERDRTMIDKDIEVGMNELKRSRETAALGASFHTISLVVGDWSGDGHSMTDTIVIESSLDKKALGAAHQAGAKKLDINMDDLCASYEDATCPADVWKKLKDAGIDNEQPIRSMLADMDDKYSLDEDGNASLYPESFAAIYLFLAKQGDPNLQYSVVEDRTSRINIGGYGLFCS